MVGEEGVAIDQEEAAPDLYNQKVKQRCELLSCRDLLIKDCCGDSLGSGSVLSYHSETL